MRLEERLSKYLIHYLYTLRMSDKNEVYETLMLMMLNDNFLRSLNILIENNLKRVRQVRGETVSEICSSREYEEAVDLVSESQYFIENFSRPDIERRKVIAKNVIVEIVTQSAIHNFHKGIKINANFFKVMYPAIEHEILESNPISKIRLTFNAGTPLDDIVRYLKDILEVKNMPKKRKMSLGQSFRMLQILNEIKDKTLKYAKQKNEYNEQIIAREMFSRYKEKVSMEAVSKSLQRIKKIKKEINTFTDK